MPILTGPTSHTFVSQRLKLHYVDWGNVKAPPLVLVHGGQDHCRSWDWLAQRLRSEWHVIAPDLRGHGDSEWSQGGNYAMSAYIYDLAQLIHQEQLAPVTIVAHSLGGNIALRYAGIVPESVRRIVAIEGLGLSPKVMAETSAKPFAERMRGWIERRRALAARLPKRYASLEEAVKRMREANKRLTGEQALHLTEHGMSRNEDGTWSWKFDNALRVWPPYEMAVSDVAALWSGISAPTLLVYGAESTASNPAVDGRVRHFRNAQLVTVAGAGHWVHHDKLDAFEALIRPFIAAH